MPTLPTNGPLLAPIVKNTLKGHHPFVLVEYDLAQSPYPLVKEFVRQSRSDQHTCLVVVLACRESNLVPHDNDDNKLNKVQCLDFSQNIPDYRVGDFPLWRDPRAETLKAIEQAPTGPVLVVIDSVDTLVEDLNSGPQTFNFLRSVLTLLQKRPQKSRLVLPIQSQALLPLLLSPAFSPSLTHIRLHSPALITHIDNVFLASPPLDGAPPTPKYWGLFIPQAKRGEGERVFLSGEEQTGYLEGIAEVLVRDKGSRKGVDRTLEGWKFEKSGEIWTACNWEDLEVLKDLGKKGRKAGSIKEASTEPSTSALESLPFNLGLTDAQKEARSLVPLPYAHEGKPLDQLSGRLIGSSQGGEILYEPDSADDMDDEDPDEDLDL